MRVTTLLRRLLRVISLVVVAFRWEEGDLVVAARRPSTGAYLSARKEGIAVGTLRMLAVTGGVPADMLAATPDMPAAEVERLRAALLGFRPQRDIDAGR